MRMMMKHSSKTLKGNNNTQKKGDSLGYSLFFF
jgi:hypothetical protein